MTDSNDKAPKWQSGCWAAGRWREEPGRDHSPRHSKKKPQEGVVVAVGPGKVLDDGSRGEMAVKKGDKVIYAKYGGTEVTVAGKDYVILDQDSIYAISE